MLAIICCVCFMLFKTGNSNVCEYCVGCLISLKRS